ncbi:MULTISPECIES: hypothetical protein [unclassified Pseudomonas]|uniref:hypothetical protein n=1 Tax=unclassified Pseudomonas TaxID=196821 RepID=UPI000C8828EB|nr:MULTISPECIES: hypothetical protein [unclassified Pseudomonas]PMZ89411.1 hypothetical protein C1X61_11320 [Pseudomonas sp. FW215-T2]PNA12253.1 hypothetical protein C1X62_12785 [Pseudomonas sp. FW215-R3]PNB37454.1 hypothetical protein C1X63_13145 [Pseudomonas sp. FW305-131]
MNRFYIEMGVAITLYTLLLLVSLILLKDQQEMAMTLKVIITLLPVIPAGLMCWAVVRNMRTLDEMHLRIQYEALGFAFAASALLTFTYGFLENVGLPHVSWVCVWPVMGLMWMIGLRLAKRRYQ